MFEIYKFDREDCTLLIVESRDFDSSELEQLENKCPLINETKGLAIAGAPETDDVLVSKVSLHYRNQSKWRGLYTPGFNGVYVCQNTADDDLMAFFVVKMKLPCLECFRQNIETEVRYGANRPYCPKHSKCSPHNSRNKKLASKAQPVIQSKQEPTR